MHNDTGVMVPFGKDLISLIEGKLRVNEGFLVGILQEKDWAFFMQCSSLFEAALNGAIIDELGRPEIESVLPFSIQQGKLPWAVQLGIVGPKEERFIRGVSQVRNQFTHRISQVGLTLEEYLASTSTDKRRSFIKSIKWGFDGHDDPSIDHLSRNWERNLILAANLFVAGERYKAAVWVGTLLILCKLDPEVRSGREDELASLLGDEVLDHDKFFAHLWHA